MKAFRVFHWDTFDNETIEIGSFDTQAEAEKFIVKKYKGRIRATGADRVDIVNANGSVVKHYPVG